MAFTQNQANDWLGQASAAQRQAEGYLQQGIAGMEGFSSQYQKEYDAIKGQIAALGMNPQAIMELSATLSPWAQQLAGMGTELYGQGRGIYDMGLGLSGTGQSILDMSASGDSLAGQYINALRAIDPNRYVSMAAGDVQSSYANVQAQLERQAARQGMSGGASQALQQKYATALASALSGAKTRARQQGLSEQLAALTQGLQLGSGMVGQGAQVASAGGSMQFQGMQGLDMAGRMTVDQAKLLSEADNMAKSQAQLSMQHASNLDSINFAKAQALLGARTTAVEYYSAQAQGFGQLAGLFMGQSGGGYHSSGVNLNVIPSTLGSGDDWWDRRMAEREAERNRPSSINPSEWGANIGGGSWGGSSQPNTVIPLPTYNN